MKELATDRNGIAAAQDFKPMTPIRIYRKRTSPMNLHNRRVIMSVAAGVMAVMAMASPVLAGPRPVTPHYAFTTVDFPGSIYTDLLGFTTQTMVGQFIDVGGNNHGWLLSGPDGTFQEFDVA